MKNIILIILAVVIAVLIIGFLIFKRWRRPATSTPDQFAQRWQELQKYCGSRKTWPQAIIEADNLLNDALKRGHYKGKTTGERLVAAQRILTSNEGVWFGHKLRNKVTGEDVRKLKKQDVFTALSGFRQALRDLGVLR